MEQLMGNSGAANTGMETRAKQGRLSFAATMFAVKAGCDCGACKLLRQAMDEVTNEAFKEAGIDVPRDHPVS
jgi:hypothetical protein